MTDDHIDQDELVLYTTGGLAAERAAEIEAHVDHCDVCASSLELEARLEETLRDAANDQCPGCRRAVTGERCDHCGAAIRVAEFQIVEVRIQNQHGRLYLATDPDGTRIALKELCFMQAPSFEALDAFEREARILCALDHPCMPRFVKSFQHGEGVHTRLYLAQEFIDGESLEERLANHYFEETEIVGIARQILHILLFLQRRSPMIIHRDIKPANLIRRHDGRIVLVDFGAARDQGSTAGATQVGTFGFMPIEQLAGVVDATTDVYALGMSMIRLLTRREPWKLLDDPWRHMTASPRLRRVLQRMTARKTEDRYSSAATALADLDALGRKRSRAPIALAATVGATVALATGIGYRATRHADKPEAQAPTIETSGSGRWTRSCENSPLSKRALLFNVASRLIASPNNDARWKQILGLVATYRTAVEALTDSVPYGALPGLDRLLALPLQPNAPSVDSVRHAAVGESNNGVHDAAVVIAGDLVTGDIESSVVVVTGTLRVKGSIRSSIVIVGGCLEFERGIVGSLAIAGASIDNSKTFAASDAAFRDSVLAAPMIRAAHSDRSVTFGGTWLDRSDDREREWEPVLEKLAAAWTPTQIPAPMPEPKPDDTGACDEVSCVLNNYEGACCARFVHGPRPQQPDDGLPEALDRAMIAEGIAPVKVEVMLCGENHPDIKGTVKVGVKVSPDGSIAGTTIKQAPDAALGACVLVAIEKARFAKTRTGGSFGYPFLF